MRLVMFVRTSRCLEYRSSYLPFEENHAQNKCAKLTTKIVFRATYKVLLSICSGNTGKRSHFFADDLGQLQKV